ncbi:GntR family transcriptional regulator [Devosia rhodophyticola]|uniref:GntR family transcriptional regulator n=1 Tax=Devosia rhodophyticola TaxID=3026423 RepID=A0ABY7YSZ8_9HYPH|nr:GntR family transcriptional regulator [Devosia rhodophyticola]WDR04503.1 GntR family transcriptional regulator [Devosia rhodophyticola]
MSQTSDVIQPATSADDLPATVYEMIREDIVSGQFAPNARLKVADLAKRYRTSTNPAREALQQLRGEGFVIMEANRGARVRPIDEAFVRDIIEIEVLIEPALTRWFVSIATDADISELEAAQDEIEALNFADRARHGQLDTKFHQLIYDRHYNRHAAELWWKHREILRAISRRYPTSLSRRGSVLSEHRELIAAIRAQDADAAAKVVGRHVEGSGRHIIEQMGAAKRQEASKRPA